MTQELILAGLLIGLVGHTWVMTIAILEGDQPRAKRDEAKLRREIRLSQMWSSDAPI